MSSSAELTRAAAARILGVSVCASAEEVIKAYKTKVMAAHPDKGGSTELCQQLNVARDKLLVHVQTEDRATFGSCQVWGQSFYAFVLKWSCNSSGLPRRAAPDGCKGA